LEQINQKLDSFNLQTTIDVLPGVKSLKFHEFKDAIGIGMYHGITPTLL
jgi:hypothetical protein